MADFTLKIDGMHCGSCVRRVSQALESAGGLKVNEVRLGAARITSSDESARDNDGIAEAIAVLAKAGYSAHLEQ